MEAAGAELRPNARVLSIVVENRRAVGVALASGEIIAAGAVLSSLDARQTLLELAPPESIGFGVFPEDGKVAGGLPNIERTLNWVHLSARFPVRVRIEDPDPQLFRIGETAVTVVR